MSDAMINGKYAGRSNHIFAIFSPLGTIKCNYLEKIKQFPGNLSY